MAEYRAGGFEWRERTYRFEEAHCSWMPGELDIEAKGNRCGLGLVGVPFPGITEVGDLPGHAWIPDDEELSNYADTFLEGGSLEVRGRQLEIRGVRIECRRYDAQRRILTVYFRLAVEDGDYGDEGEADGVAYCRIDPSAEVDV
jgi:hypothetical protein